MVVHPLHTRPVGGSNPPITTKFAPVAQLDRVSVFETAGWEFKSLRGHQFYGVVSVKVNTTDCDSVNMGSIPILLPKFATLADVVIAAV